MVDLDSHSVVRVGFNRRNEVLTMAKSETVTVEFTKGAEKKWSVVYETPNADAPVRSLYVQRSWLGSPVPSGIKITFEAVG